MGNVTVIEGADVPQCTTVRRDGATTVFVTRETVSGRRSVHAGEALKVGSLSNAKLFYFLLL